MALIMDALSGMLVWIGVAYAVVLGLMAYAVMRWLKKRRAKMEAAAKKN